MVFVIRCVPDPFTDERINVGVCAIDAETGVRFVKVISEPGRLHCLYGDMAYSVVNLAQVAGEAAQKGLSSPSSQIIFDVPSPFFNSTAASVVENTFADQISVAIPQREQKQQAQVDDDLALQKVADAIKLQRTFDFDLIANTPQVIVQTERGPRPMKIPLQPKNGVGTVKSAYYSASTLKSHLLDSILDLECAARYREKTHLGMFILRRNDENRKDMASIDSVIDSIAARASRHMYIEVATQPDELAEACAKWGALAT